MSPHRYLLVGFAALFAAACSQDTGGITTPTFPLAQVRFLNAVPDTGALDFRLVDYIENSPSFTRVAFRGGMVTYRPIQAGDRHLKIFMNSTDQAVASTAVLDTTFTFEENTHYTVILTGFMQPGNTPGYRAMIVTDDTPPTPDDGHFALRVLNLGAGMGPVDVYYHRKSDTSPGSSLATGLDYEGISDWTSIEVTNDSLRLAIAEPGVTSPLLADALVNIGIPGTSTSNPSPGTNVGGSVMTAVIVPPSVAGSTAPQTSAFAAPSVVILYDNRPTNTAG